MSKDPAFLFYSSDFLTGTMMMDNEQVGKYIRLLCLQHQKGHLSDKDMMKICLTYDEDIFDKFVKDDQGFYYNVRLDCEVARRVNYSRSRSENRKSKTDMINISLSYDEHMETENININDKDISNEEEIRKESAEREEKSEEPGLIKQTKKRFGTHKNVLLTDEEHERLEKKYRNCQEIIDWFSDYIVEKGYKSKSHNLSIQRWVADAVDKDKRKGGTKGNLNVGNFNQRKYDYDSMFEDVVRKE